MAHPATSFATEVYLLARRHLDNFAAGGGTIPENIAAQLLGDVDIAQRGLHDEQRGVVQAPQVFIVGSVSNS